MKVLGWLVVLGVVGFGIFFVADSMKPAVIARVDLSKTMLYVTNGNDQAWESAQFILNDAFDGARFDAKGPWKPGEKRELDLARFYSPIRKQWFKPDYERVQEVIILVPDHQLWHSK